MRKKFFIHNIIIILLIWLSACDEPAEPFHMPQSISYLPIDSSIPLPLPEFESYDKSLYSLMEGLEVEDTINSRTWKYNILLPPSYNECEEFYPVLYLLHGWDSNRNSWTRSLDIAKMINYCHEESFSPEIIVVMPDAENTYYVDGFQEGIKYETFFINNFIPYIETTYRVKSGKYNHIIGGFSMGGYGAAYYLLRYNDLFGICFCMSAPLNGKGDAAQMESLFPFYSAIESANQYYLIDIGYDDLFLNANLASEILLRSLNLPHEFIIREGGHNPEFWKESLFILFNRINQLINYI